MRTKKLQISASLAMIAMASVSGVFAADAPAPTELPAWAAGTLPKAEAYERDKAKAEYEASVRPNLPEQAIVEPKQNRRLLVFHNPRNFRHTSEVLLRHALPDLAEKTGAFSVTITDDPGVFTPENLATYDAIFFNQVNSVNGIGAPNQEQCQAILDFVAAGGGWAGVHASIVGLSAHKEGADFLGGRFGNHPFGGKLVTIKNEIPASPLTDMFGAEPFELLDEIFIINNPYSREKQTVLLSVDWERSPEAQAAEAAAAAKGNKGFRDDQDYAVSWVKPWGKGRVFYTSLGHEHATIADPRYLKHLLAGLQYALGDLPSPDAHQ